MKTIYKFLSLILIVSLTLVSCGTDDMNYADAQVTAVKKLYEPSDNRSVKLISSATASLYFQWEAVKVEDSGAALYEVIFDKAGGDFSNPVYRVVADNGGYVNAATIPHKTLNAIAAKAGIGIDETGELIWTVVSSRGLNQMMAEEQRSLTVTTLAGFAEIPDEVFITGEATEVGTALNDALPFKLTTAGEFEIYTKLEAGKTYYFVDRKNDNARIFYSENGVRLLEAEAGTEGAITPKKTGVYKINLDFNVATISCTEITSLGLFFSPDNKVLWDLSYKGKGIWEGEGKVTLKPMGGWIDERYKFQMETIDGSGKAQTVQWGPTIAGLDSRPTGTEDYFFMQLAPSVTQYDNKWKFPLEVDGKETTITIYLQGNSQYRHEVKF